MRRTRLALALMFVAFGLSGCTVYSSGGGYYDPYYEPAPYYAPAPYYGPPAVYGPAPGFYFNYNGGGHGGGYHGGGGGHGGGYHGGGGHGGGGHGH